MNKSQDYFREKLYPFQDGILKTVNELGLPFYLTGGTALSRFYYNHRFSNDLDLFVNNDNDYSRHVNCLWDYLVKTSKNRSFTIDKTATVRSENFTQIVLYKQEVILQIDLVNDIAPHYGSKKKIPGFCPIDGWGNILSNKLTVLYRFEPKDYVDLLFIHRNESFSWKIAIEQAKNKEAGLDPLLLSDMIKTIPQEQLTIIKWVDKMSKRSFQ